MFSRWISLKCWPLARLYGESKAWDSWNLDLKITSYVKWNVRYVSSTNLVWLGKVTASHVFLQAPYSSWKANKQIKIVPYAVVSVVTLCLVWCFLNILVQQTLLNSSPGRRIWWTKLTFSSHLVHLMQVEFSGWEIQLSAEGYSLLSTKGPSWPINSWLLFQTFLLSLFWDLQGCGSHPYRHQQCQEESLDISARTTR